MIYWITVLSKWFQHVHILFFAVLFADLFLIAIYSDGLGEVVTSAGQNWGKSASDAFLIILFGPFINIYGFYHCCKSFLEEESDLYATWQNSKPEISSRRIWSHLSGPLLAMIFVPPFMWFYTNGLVLFWGEERVFFNTLGFYVSLLIALITGFIYQKNNNQFKKYQKKIQGV